MKLFSFCATLSKNKYDPGMTPQNLETILTTYAQNIPQAADQFKIRDSIAYIVEISVGELLNQEGVTALLKLYLQLFPHLSKDYKEIFLNYVNSLKMHHYLIEHKITLVYAPDHYLKRMFPELMDNLTQLLDNTAP